MVAAVPSCDSVQAALLEGLSAEWVADHVARCDECRFVEDLSRDLGPVRSASSVGEVTALGSAVDSLLGLAQESARPLLSRYLLQQRLGGGGQGVVYRALNTDTGETVALKVIRARGAPTEVIHAHRVRHPSVCRIYHTETHGELRLIEMEFIEGESLAAGGQALSNADRLRVFRSVCRAIQAAHEARVLHLDLKPSNILLRTDGEPVVTDFGLSVSLDAGKKATPLGGTPRFMAPEQRDGQPVDQRTDVFALGRLLEELVERPTAFIARVIRRATDEDPGRRYPDGPSLLRDLDRPMRLRRRALLLSAVLAPLGLAGLALRPGRWTGQDAGDVLVLGGIGPDQRWTASAEVFDAAAMQWRTVDPVPDPGRSLPRMCEARAVRAGNEVLVLGGGSSSGCADDGATTNRVRIFTIGSAVWAVPRCQDPCLESEGETFWLDPAEGDVRLRWKKGACQPAGPCMQFGRSSFAAIGLANEDVFVVGGCAGACVGPNDLGQTIGRPAPLARTAEIYRRALGRWQALPPGLHPRAGAAAVDLSPNVLVCGGDSGLAPKTDGSRPGSTCELYDPNSPANGAPPWRPAGTMPSAAVPVLVALGPRLRGVALGVQPGQVWLWRMRDPWNFSAWSFDESFFQALPVPDDGIEGGTLTQLPDGGILLAGGSQSGRASTAARVLMLDSQGHGEWKTVAPMHQARSQHVAVQLPDGKVLVAGGCAPQPLASAELYDPARDVWLHAGTLATARCVPQGVALW